MSGDIGDQVEGIMFFLRDTITEENIRFEHPDKRSNIDIQTMDLPSDFSLQIISAKLHGTVDDPIGIWLSTKRGSFYFLQADEKNNNFYLKNYGSTEIKNNLFKLKGRKQQQLQ